MFERMRKYAEQKNQEATESRKKAEVELNAAIVERDKAAAQLEVTNVSAENIEILKGIERLKVTAQYGVTEDERNSAAAEASKLQAEIDEKIQSKKQELGIDT